MCLIIDRNIHPDLKPIKLRKDKVVWKLLDPGYTSTIFEFKYRRGQTYTDKGIFTVGKSLPAFGVITKAFHAYTPEAQERDFFKMKKFVIPAGSLVYYGWDGEICSDAIRFPRVNE